MRIPLPPYRDTAATPRSTSRSNSQTSEDSLQPREAMVIPGARFNDVPPPLPPPRYNNELAQGVDVAWKWANGEPFETQRHLAPIKPGSSLYGGYLDSRTNLGRAQDPDEMDLDDDDFTRRSSNVSTVRSPSHADIRLAGSVPALIRKPPSPTLTSQRLQGEVPLAQRNFDRSSQAYDQRLLSKIGKSNSPPRHQRSGSTESSSYGTKLSLQTKDSKVQLLSANELPSAVFDPVSRWITSPVSAGVSPGSRAGWRDYNMDHRSPSMDSTSNSLVLDPELFLQPRPTGLPVAGGSGATPGFDEVASIASRSHRGSYDQGFFAETESDIGGEDGNAFRNLNLSDRPEQQVGRRSSKQGMKRRAGSPPSDVARDDKSPSRGTASAELFQKVTTTASARSPVSKYYQQPKYGSVSSTASSVRQNSYASSVALSVAGSSMTSISSFERQSPLDPASQPAYITSAQPVSSPATSIAPSRKQSTQSPLDTKPPFSKSSTQPVMSDSRLPPATRVGNYFICDCCPKKPKKFDTEAELRAHQMEKQYTCQYCNNRFKNKNEAERHQNSLHLRRHSWSCAAITRYEAAFHPSSSPSGGGASTDVCGYCGEEFPNLPQPDWDRRIDHLTNVHKFGECNQSKKFYRADHFRQHLKHSHAGQSGKWTNMLENVCLREEIPQDPIGISPSGSDSSPGRGPSGLSDRPMGGATIDEAQDET
ncbi:C2H2 finger domain protein [Fonsecaea pedrosoi]|nr:C2H2 finger domain protein [Fonsecaea pedrosoi]